MGQTIPLSQFLETGSVRGSHEFKSDRSSVRLSVCNTVFLRLDHFFLIFYMKLGFIKLIKVTDPIFEENYCA